MMIVKRWSSRIIIIVIWFSGVNSELECTPDESTNPYCVCHFNNGSVIDLRSISKKNGPRCGQ